MTEMTIDDYENIAMKRYESNIKSIDEAIDNFREWADAQM